MKRLSEMGKKDPKSVTLNVRMGETTYDWLAGEAEKRGLMVSALARMFVLQKLSEEGGEPPYETVVMTGGPEASMNYVTIPSLLR